MNTLASADNHHKGGQFSLNIVITKYNIVYSTMQRSQRYNIKYGVPNVFLFQIQLKLLNILIQLFIY